MPVGSSLARPEIGKAASRDLETACQANLGLSPSRLAFQKVAQSGMISTVFQAPVHRVRQEKLG
jgi:hypothetical protein